MRVIFDISTFWDAFIGPMECFSGQKSTFGENWVGRILVWERAGADFFFLEGITSFLFFVSFLFWKKP